MSNGYLCAILALSAGAMPASAMSSPQRPCSVKGAEKLPTNTLSATAICNAVEHEIVARKPHLQYTAKIQVLSKSSLKATVVSNGRTLAQQQLSVMDRNLNSQSIERFAIRLADEVAKAGKS